MAIAMTASLAESRIKHSSLAEQAAAIPLAVVYDQGNQDDVPEVARIAAVTFAEVAVNLFPHGATPEAIAYRAVMFDSHYAGSLAYRQGRRKRPQGFFVARHPDTLRVIGFITWAVQGGGEEQEAEYALTDGILPKDYTALPPVAEPPGWDVSVRESFVENSDKSQKACMGDRKRCYIKYLCVDPTVQRSGAGRALLHLVRRSNPGLPLYLEAATTPSAGQFYLKLGFQQLGTMMFKKALKPLPCMSLEADTDSLIDDASVIAAVGTASTL